MVVRQRRGRLLLDCPTASTDDGAVSPSGWHFDIPAFLPIAALAGTRSHGAKGHHARRRGDDTGGNRGVVSSSAVHCALLRQGFRAGGRTFPVVSTRHFHLEH